jgi:Asp/Glu/hydantoin racemase
MPKQIALIHTSPSMVPLFKTLTDELIPKDRATIFNMVDESLLCDIIRDGYTPAKTARRLVSHVIAADDAGAQMILVTCSSMGRAVEASRALVNASVLRVDEPMAQRAVETGSRIGVIATLPSTLEPTVVLVKRCARDRGKQVEVQSIVVEGAFDAVISGDGAKHDLLVAAGLKDLAGKVDAIVLAQASMARVVDSLPPADKPVPILSSPRLAVAHLAALLAQDRK